MTTIFEFKADWFVDGRSEPLTVKAPRVWVEQFISLKEFYPLIIRAMKLAKSEFFAPLSGQKGARIGLAPHFVE